MKMFTADENGPTQEFLDFVDAYDNACGNFSNAAWSIAEGEQPLFSPERIVGVMQNIIDASNNIFGKMKEYS